MMTNLLHGDVVRLKSGGPNLTISQIYGSIEDPSLTVVWFDDENRLQSATLYVSMVTPSWILARGPIIPQPGESYEDAVRRKWQRKK